MGLRVHELAKEFKISTAALKKHLSDLGVVVKSHMSIVDDETVKKIRAKFKEQMAAVKKMESDRKKYHVDGYDRRDRKRSPKPYRKQEKDIFKSKNEYSNQSSPHKKRERDADFPFREALANFPTERLESDHLKAAGTTQKPPVHKKPVTSDERIQKPARTEEAPKEDKSYTAHQTQNTERPAGKPNDNRSNDRRDYRRDDRPSGDRRDQRPRRNYNDRQQSYDRNTSGERRDNRNYQGNRSDNRGYQGNRQDNRNYQGNRSDNRGSQGNRQDNRNYQGNRSDNRGYQGNRSDNRGYQGNRSDNRGYQGNRNTDNRGQKPYQSRDNRPPRPPRDTTGFNKPEPPKAPVTDLATTDSRLDKKFGKKKKDVQEFGEKSKHLKAKINSVKKKKKKFKPTELEEAEITKSIKQTLAKPKKKKKYKKEEKVQGDVNETKVITLSEFTSVNELAKIMDISPAEIITKFFMMGQMVTINQRLDKESLEMVCDEFNFDIQFQDEFGTDIIEKQLEQESVDIEAEERAPIVTVMGHVDHGKTSILDRIRHANIVAGESGGITQHIGAYQVEYNDKKITFLDTPGHEAFTAMRSRGANVTDIAIIVVAANDGVMPQTLEAIDHAKAAGVTVIVAINKIDLPQANPDRAIAGLLEHNLYLEGYGGEVLWTSCSAKTGEGIDDLLDLVLLAAEMKELKAKQKIAASGVVIESEKDTRMGAVATILIREGTLTKGDVVVCGATYGRVRKMENERNKELHVLKPSDVAVIYGLNSVPKAGDILNQVKNDKIARQISSERQQIRHEREKYQSRTNLNNLFEKIKENQRVELKLIVKADTDGSVEALADSFQKLNNDEINVNIIHKAVGGISENDVTLASASDAIIIGFHVRSSNQAKKIADDENVDIKIYSVIYDAIDDIKNALEGMLSPELKEKYLGNAAVKQIFKIRKLGSIAGCAVEKGLVKKDAKVRLFRNNIMIHEGEISSLRHYAEEVAEVKAGSECGIGILGYNDLKAGDVIEAYEILEVKREL